MTLFVTLSRYKIKDTYATSQMLDYAMTAMAAKGFQLQELKNLMISAEGRPRPDICMYAKAFYCRARLLTPIPQIKECVYTLPPPAWTGLQSTLSTRMS